MPWTDRTQHRGPCGPFGRGRDEHDPPIDLVTGAFSYSGGAIAERLLGSGRRVRTLTFHPQRERHLQARVETSHIGSTTRRRSLAALMARPRSTTPAGFASTMDRR